MSKYVSKNPDGKGVIHWDDIENKTWNTLYERQIEIVKNRACQEYNNGLKLLNMSSTCIPQLSELNKAFESSTGWSVVKVPAMIKPVEFFELLANKKFPAATFIRTVDELDYLEEPDIFHELFGHCPMITHQPFADFMQAYGEFALDATVEKRKYLARLFWFTVEFGLIKTKSGPLCYGGGILSSKNETVYAVESDVPKRLAFDLVNIFRTSYRVDQMQGVYFVLNDFEQLYAVLSQDIDAAIEKALSLGEFGLIEIEKGADKDEWVTC